jgi:hypothetical protein
MNRNPVPPKNVPPNPVANYLATLDYQEPPEVTVIEASCALAETRNDTNNKWTNVLKEPFLLKKGSQIRVASSYTNMRGMDQEIIQFIPDGDNQDNSHTMIVQLYSVNDGVNGKTTSYDYIAHNQQINSYEYTVVGNSLAVNANTSTTAITGVGSGLAFNISSITPTNIMPRNLTITNPGSKYRTGDNLEFSGGTGTNAIGHVICNDLGQVISFYFTNFGAYTANPTAIAVSTSSGGSGATITFNVNTGNVINGIDIISGGQDYEVGDIVEINNGTTKPQIRILSVLPGGVVPDKIFFDQGYNYQRIPLYRWTNTFDCSQNFCYARNFGDRTFIANNGRTVSVYQQPPQFKQDVNLSCGFEIQNKEDEFCSGIFHNQGQNTEFNIRAPVISISNDNLQVDILLETYGGESFISIPNIEETYQDSNDKSLGLYSNPLNQLSVGQCFQLTFTMKDRVDIPDDATFNALQQLYDNWGGVFNVGKNESFSDDLTIDGNVYTDGYRRITLGCPGQYNGANVGSDNSGETFSLPLVGGAIDYQFGGTNNISGDPLATYTADFENDTREDGAPMTGSGASVSIQISGTGTGWNSYSVVSAGTGYKFGDICSIPNQDGSPNDLKVYVISVDGIGGIRFCAQQGSSLFKNDFVANGNNAQINIVPVPFYMGGIGDLINRPGDGSFDLNYNSVCVIQNVNSVSGCSYENYLGVYPPTIDNLGIEPSVDHNSEYLSNNAICALHKPNGKRSEDNNYKNLNANFSLHSDQSSLSITDYSSEFTSISEFTLTTGTDAATSQFYIGGVNPMPSGQFTFSILASALPSSYKSIFQNYMILEYVNSDTDNVEEHVYIKSVNKTATHFEFQLKARNVQSVLTPLTNSTALGINNDTEYYRGNIPASYNIASGTTIKLRGCPDWVGYKTNVKCLWGDGDVNEIIPGKIGFTSRNNFYNTNDYNYSTLQTSNDWKDILNGQLMTTDILDSYNQGGNYYLTNATGYLASENRNPLNGSNNNNGQLGSNIVGFSQGFNEFPISQIYNEWQPTFLTETDQRIITEGATNVQAIFAYEPLLRQKTFVTPQNFATPSAIGANWTRTSHELTGATNMENGSIMTQSQFSGLLQNEFCFPIYGSNNIISPSGRYIPNTTLYPNSQGLEPGHVVGINGVDQNANYLATQMMNSIPLDANSNSFYFVFFRTFFTIVRNYDPLKSTGTLPDRSAVKTVQTEAKDIGNVNDSKATPPVTTRKTLDGTTLIDINTGGTPDRTAYKLYELGKPNPTVADDPAFFPSTSTEYPVRYIENDDENNFGKAKASCYVGASNLTLAYSQDISTFTFQFFYQEYTTPFIEGTGGDISIRIFYGNRLNGIYNHDAFGGVSVVNFARPDFPHNVFTYQEILNELPTAYYPNGLDPLTDTSPVGLRFLNKLGYTDADVGVVNNKIDLSLNKLGFNITNYARDIILDDTSSVTFSSFTTTTYGTNYGEIDSSDSILSSIPPPEAQPGLNSHVSIVIPTHGKSRKIIQLFGDYIFYPYSFDAATNTFNDVSKVEYNNCADTYGSIGGLNLTSGSQLRGTGLPNTVGSTSIVNPSTIPVSLNPDCNLYLSYTVQTNSDQIKASSLPIKLNHGHMVILSSLIQRPNYILNKQGRLPGVSIINKTFLQGDYILSLGQLTFYAYEDKYISEITTEIVNNDFSIPASLGKESTVIYEISNFNPKPATAPSTINQKQQAAYLINSQVSAMQQKATQGQPKVSKMSQLLGDLNKLGLATLRDPEDDNSSIINSLSQYIRGYDLLNLSPQDRQTFYQSDIGQEFARQASQLLDLMGNYDPSTTDITQVLSELGAMTGLPPLAGQGELLDFEEPALMEMGAGVDPQRGLTGFDIPTEFEGLGIPYAGVTDPFIQQGLADIPRRGTAPSQSESGIGSSIPPPNLPGQVPQSESGLGSIVEESQID